MKELTFTTYRMSKSRLVKKLGMKGRRDLLRMINNIVATNRQQDVKDCKHYRFLQSREVLELLKKLGEEPERFGRKVEIPDLGMTKFGLGCLFHKMSAPEFRRTINSIISERRGIDIETAKRKKQLYPNEVIDFLNRIGEVMENASPCHL